MKKIFTLTASVLAFTSMSFGQIGAVAPDFTVTDLDGTTHNLYSILNSGKVVILDCSATWCGPCWGFHGGHYLEDIHNTYGPAGTDQVRVIFYEADAATTLADLQGTTGATQGDWLTGTSYPVTNESPITLSGTIFWPLGFPTVNVIAPGDKKIKADLWDPWSQGGGLAEMVDIINDYFPAGVGVEELAIEEVSVFPSPSTGDVSVRFNAAVASDLTINVTNLTGQVVYTTPAASVAGSNQIDLNLAELADGQYIVKISNGQAESISRVQISK